jgi:hypothetical protein
VPKDTSIKKEDNNENRNREVPVSPQLREILVSEPANTAPSSSSEEKKEQSIKLFDLYKSSQDEKKMKKGAPSLIFHAY